MGYWRFFRRLWGGWPGPAVPPRVACCSAPKLARVRVLLDLYSDQDLLLRCASCGAHWLNRYSERMNFDGGEDHVRNEYYPLTDEEARRLAESEGQPDLSFVAGRQPHQL